MTQIVGLAIACTVLLAGIIAIRVHYGTLTFRDAMTILLAAWRYPVRTLRDPDWWRDGTSQGRK